MSKKNTNTTTTTRETIMAEYKTWRTKFNARWDAEQKEHAEKLATWKKELTAYIEDRDAKLAAAKAAAAKPEAKAPAAEATATKAAA